MPQIILGVQPIEMDAFGFCTIWVDEPYSGWHTPQKRTARLIIERKAGGATRAERFYKFVAEPVIAWTL